MSTDGQEKPPHYFDGNALQNENTQQAHKDFMHISCREAYTRFALSHLLVSPFILVEPCSKRGKMLSCQTGAGVQL
jgi:hypothetical protein